MNRLWKSFFTFGKRVKLSNFGFQNSIFFCNTFLTAAAFIWNYKAFKNRQILLFKGIWHQTQRYETRASRNFSKLESRNLRYKYLHWEKASVCAQEKGRWKVCTSSNCMCRAHTQIKKKRGFCQVLDCVLIDPNPSSEDRELKWKMEKKTTA